ncbi:MAG: alpha/beta fold hydrolase [Alphaproteobacteria bacterium]|nr:alpha/beta fold hydrolase [Alphaproteobacteria bacterium]
MIRPNTGSFPFTDENGTIWLGFVDWGSRRRGRVVICAHGVTRQGRDFDALARSMADDFQVIELDVAGRGRSGWLADKTAYTFEAYLRHARALMDYRGIATLDWVGTSMGGIMGMLLAAEEELPIRRLVINDTDRSYRARAWTGLEPILAPTRNSPIFRPHATICARFTRGLVS